MTLSPPLFTLSALCFAVAHFPLFFYFTDSPLLVLLFTIVGIFVETELGCLLQETVFPERSVATALLSFLPSALCWN